MPIIPPVQGDQIVCEITLIAHNISARLHIDSVKAQSAEVFLQRTQQLIGTITFWPDGSKIPSPGERDTISVYQSTDIPYPFSGTKFEPSDSVSLHLTFVDNIGNTKILATPNILYLIVE